MTPEQWARVKDVFNAALAEDPHRRRAFVAEASRGDEAIRSEVERLLDADSASADFIEYPAADTLVHGRVIGHYEIVRLLGAGGMGRVYAARDVELGREVALKVASADSEDAQARLRREAQHASRLSHPHICHIYEVGRDGDQLFVVMELIPGRSLADLLQDGPLSVANARRYGAEIADALAHAHESGVMHRDLKSTNVIITPHRGVKVLDFGLARRIDTHQIEALSHSQRSLTAEGMIAGTLPYMAPELLRGQRGDQRADIWALGVLLYEMVSGHRPFTGGTGFELSAAILRQPPETLPPSVPPALRAIVQRCLANDPSDRYQSAADVQRALEEMNGAAGVGRSRIPAIPMRRAAGVLLLVVALVVGAIVTYGIRSDGFSNIRGYSFLESGNFAEALAEFQGVANRQEDDANAWDSLGEGYLANGMPDKALEAYSRALAIEPDFEHSVIGRGLSLAALGRYAEALEKPAPNVTWQAFLLSRVGRYREASEVLETGQRAAKEDDDAEGVASALVSSSWLLTERQQYGPALEQIRAAEMTLPIDEQQGLLRVLIDYLAGVAEIRSGNVMNAISRLELQKARYDSDEPVEAKWVAALEGEVALAQGQYDRAMSSFKAAQMHVWQTLGPDSFGVFAMNLPSRDGAARVEIARGNRAAAIEEYRRLTSVDSANQSAVLEPRHVLALARLLDEGGNADAARAEYERFLKLWTNAEEALPETEEVRRALARLSAG
jgi:tetratricopeptide (TPR) repeat protein